MNLDVSRRSILKGSLSAAVLAAMGSPLLTGCGSGGSGAAGAVQSANNAVKLPTYVKYQGVTPDMPGNTQGVMDAFLKYPSNPTRAFTSAPGDGKKITAMTITAAPIPPGLDQNAYWQELNKRLGSDLELSITPWQDYTQKFATTVAGNSLPDLFNVDGNAPDLPQLLASKAVDLTPHLSGDAAKKYPFLANIPTDSWKGTVFDGKIYGIPIPRGVLSTTVLYYRSDILDAQGIKVAPTSFDDFFALTKQLTSSKSNKWALTIVPVDYIRQMYGIANNWSEKDGKLTSAYEAPEQKDALSAARKMVQAGVVNPGTFAASAQNYKAWFGNGTAVMHWDTFSAWPQFYQIQMGNGPFAVAAAPIPSFSGGGKGSTWLGNPNNSISAISKASEGRLETLLNVLNWLAAPFGTEEYLFRKYGVAGVDYNLKGTDPILTDKGKSETQLAIQYLSDAPWPIYQAGLEKATKDQYQAQVDLVPNGKRDPSAGIYSPTQSKKGTILKKKMTDLQNDILQGRQPVSAWDDGVKSWKSGGGDAIRDELQKALSA